MNSTLCSTLRLCRALSVFSFMVLACDTWITHQKKCSKVPTTWHSSKIATYANTHTYTYMQIYIQWTFVYYMYMNVNMYVCVKLHQYVDLLTRMSVIIMNRKFCVNYIYSFIWSKLNIEQNRVSTQFLILYTHIYTHSYTYICMYSVIEPKEHKTVIKHKILRDFYAICAGNSVSPLIWLYNMQYVPVLIYSHCNEWQAVI